MKKALHLVLTCAVLIVVGCSKRSTQAVPDTTPSSPVNAGSQTLSLGRLSESQHQQITQYYDDFNFVVQNSSASDLATILRYINYPAGDSTFLKDSRMKDLYEKTVGIISRETSVDPNMATGPRYVGKFDFGIMPLRVLGANDALVEIETLRIATERVQTVHPVQGSEQTYHDLTIRVGTYGGPSDRRRSPPSTNGTTIPVDPPSYYEIHRWQISDNKWLLAPAHVVPVLD